MEDGSAQMELGSCDDPLRGVKLIRSVELGTVAIIEALWERLGIGKALRSLGNRGKRDRQADYERALLAMTANRLCEPESKLGVWSRWLEKVYLPSCRNLKLEQMYEAMDRLYENASSVEEAVFFETANLLNLDVDLVFYDTTTASFHIDYEDEENGEGEGLRRFGHSKEGTWTPQVVVALAVTQEGYPVKSWVFPGNTADVMTIETVKKDLRGWKLGRALFVSDSGMNSQDNRRELGRACGKYLIASRLGSVAEIKDKVLSARGRYKNVAENLKVKEVVVGDGERRRRYFLCYNPREAKRQKRHRAEVVEKLEAELKKHRDKNAQAQWAIELLASRRFKRYLTVTEEGRIRIDRKAIREAARFDGKWVLETNDDTISTEDAACGYRALMVIERCFRSLKKTQIKMMPMYHWLPRRIIAHVKICVFALLIQRVAENTCGDTWPKIRQELAKIQATEYHTENFQFFRRNETPKTAADVFEALKIPLPKRVCEVSPLSPTSSKS